VIPSENIILFDKTKESLEEFVTSIIPGNIKIVEDMEEAIDEFEEEMTEATQNVD